MARPDTTAQATLLALDSPAGRARPACLLDASRAARGHDPASQQGALCPLSVLLVLVVFGAVVVGWLLGA